METVTIKIRNKRKFTKFMEFVKDLDYVEIVSDKKPSSPKKSVGMDIFDLEGLWKDRDITIEDIRAKAWPKRK